MPESAHQLSGHNTFLADATRHGSAYVGEFRILRVYSFDEAITMKLQRGSASALQLTATTKAERAAHMWKTEAALSGPEFHPAM